MDPMRALDMEVRSGISSSEIDDFASRMDMIAQAMDEIKNGTFDPAACKIPGYKTPEQEEAERLAKLEREQERQRREAERKRKAKHDEHANWWTKAKLRYSVDDEDTSNNNNNNNNGDASQRNAERTKVAANRALAACTERDTNDYSVWSTWEPQDPVTLEETAAREAELERERNRAFEESNPEFCSQFKADLEKRQSTQREKERVAEKLKMQGNACYRRKQYAKAIEHYMKALDALPFSVAVLANLAQCYLRLQDLDDAIEFSTRALFIDPGHVKALSRRATARYLQQQWHDAANDMERALQLEPLNEDVVEQHSIIVGDYDDSVAQQQLDAVMATGSKSSPGASVSSTTADELRFVVELLQRMDDSAASGSDTNQEETADETTALVKPMWIAYELLLPLLERNESIRTLIRTSGELWKLCSRIVAVFTAERFVETLSRDHDQELIANAMLACATAAMTSCPRNQIVMYQDAPFRKHMLAALTTAVWVQRTDGGSDAVTVLPWSTLACVLQFFEEAVELKSWKRLVATTPSALCVLLSLLPLTQAASAATSTTQERRTFEALAQERLVLSASSICVTLSSDEHTLREFANEASTCAQSIAKALEQTTTTHRDSRVVANVLGFLTNLSTLEAFRAAVDSDDAVTRGLARTLLRSALDSAIAAVKTRDAMTPERALAALLNLSFHPNARVRQDLLTCSAVPTLTSILQTMTPATYTMQALTLSRAVGLLCRLHAVVLTDADKMTETSGDGTSYSAAVIETAKQLMHSDVLDELYRICLQALSTASSPSATSAPPSETWQLCAQIWCHVGWCVHAPSVRTYLRDKRALHAIIETVRLANAQAGGYRSTALSDGASVRERLVGNAVKVLITLQPERKDEDLKVFAKPAHLTTLVAALQALPDGLACKNVAILLAKLCQADARVKDDVRKLRGIEMMLSVSQALQQQTQTSASLTKARPVRHTAPGAAF